MIKGKDIYEILAAIVPLYVAMILGYGSIRWWKILTPDESSGINRFVAMFAIPFLTFNFISPINPYHMLNLKFIAADTLQKIATLCALFLWNTFTKRSGIDWSITLFALTTLPNTLLVGVPLLNAMYGEFTTSLLIQIVVMQSIVWYTLLLFLYEYRAAKNFISQKIIDTIEEGSVSVNVVSNKVDSINDGYLNGREPLYGDVEMVESGSAIIPSSHKSHSTSKVNIRADFYTNNLQNVGFEDKMHNKRFWRSKSCPDASSDLGTTTDDAASKPVDILQEIVTSKDVHELTDCAKVSGDREHEIEGGIKSLSSEFEKELDTKKEIENKQQQTPPAHSSMIKLILDRVWRKLIRNPNIYAALLGLAWSLISHGWNIKMPSIIRDSISIMSKTGLGMAMFSLGIFTALQPKFIACGKTLAAISMAIKFLIGPAVIGATSFVIGLHGVLLQVSIVQAAIPQGIVPFVFARQYNLHAEVLSTAVIFGMVVALPVTLLYYMLLGL